MPAPFYNAIKGTTSGTPGTGAFTPSAASSGFRAWSNVPTGWIGLVRYEDGTAWELTYSYWNGTTLSRASTQVYDSSTGSQLTLSSSATAAMVVDASEVMSHLGTTPWRGWAPTNGGTSHSFYGIPNVSVAGTAAGASISNTSFLTEQPRAQATSATTASAQAGEYSTQAMCFYSTAAGHGCFEFTTRFGASQIPTGPRMFVGASSTTVSGLTTEPSTFGGSSAAFTLDSTDTNFQLTTKDGTTSGKTDTGIPFVANGWYEVCVWAEPGGGKIYGLLIRMDTGAIWFGNRTTNLPANGATMLPQVIGGLNGTNTGTALVLCIGAVTVRSGS